jgi:hypothetical protein
MATARHLFISSLSSRFQQAFTAISASFQAMPDRGLFCSP